MFDAFRRLTARYGDLSKAAPLRVAFAACWVKGAASDMTSQVVLERRSLSNADFSGAETTTVRRASEGMRMPGPLNFRRTCAFATFSGAYGGCFQHVAESGRPGRAQLLAKKGRRVEDIGFEKTE